MNIILGHNGAGKTTILEAISIASLSKSFLPTPDSLLINSAQSKYSVHAKAQTDLQVPYAVTGHSAQVDVNIFHPLLVILCHRKILSAKCLLLCCRLILKPSPSAHPMTDADLSTALAMQQTLC